VKRPPYCLGVGVIDFLLITRGKKREKKRGKNNEEKIIKGENNRKEKR
jgi:hypothetical protein